MGLVDWLDTQEPIIKTDVGNLANITNLLNKKDRELDELNNLDLFNCMKIRALAEADIKYFNDHSDLCLAGEDTEFINKFMSKEGQSIFNPVIAKETFTNRDYVFAK